MGIRGKLRKKGFINDQSPDAPICRWIYRGEKVDVKPDDPSILGFSNRWYHDGIASKKKYTLPSGLDIYIFEDVYFLAAKIEAVKDRGGEDWRGSHDFEDIVYLLNYSRGIIDKIKAAPTILKQYMSKEFANMLKRSNLREEVECTLPYEEIDQALSVIRIMKDVASL